MEQRLKAAALALLIVVGAAGCGRPRGAGSDGAAAGRPSTPELQDYDFGGDFTLTSHLGAPFRLSDESGKVVFLFFGYTTCPDACPLTMSKISDVVKRVEGARDRIAVLFVTVDVDRDTPAMLANYVSSFRLPMVGLTGTRAAVDAVVAQYRAIYEITPSASAGGVAVGHSTYTYLIDRSGKLRYIFSYDDSAETMADVLKAVLR